MTIDMKWIICVVAVTNFISDNGHGFAVNPNLDANVSDGHGCEKKLDQYCPGWDKESKITCRACVLKNLHSLEPNCTLETAQNKCGQHPSPPSPPTPPSPPPPGPSPIPPRPTPTNRTTPNIFFMLTDDQDIQLGSMNAMSFTRQLGKQGANFTNFFAHTTVCCPSRSELLTGRYFHNIKASTFGDSGCMHVNTSVDTPSGNPLTMATALKTKGYATGAFGKYLNSGGMQEICAPPVGNNTGVLVSPEGWTEFFGACPDTCYVDCSYSHNGKLVKFTDPNFVNGSNYGTAVIGNLSLAFINNAMAANWPFFAYVASHAPHGPATPAAWYADLYSGADVVAPRTPSFNVSSPDKHWVVRTQPYLTHEYVDSAIDAFYKNRMRSLRSVDDIVAAAYKAVSDANQLDRTYFIFTSDHGLHMGQFCLGACKRQPYETDIRIPFLIVGPGISPQLHTNMAGIPDVAPTILDLASATDTTTLPMDGRSIVPLLMTNLTTDPSTNNRASRDTTTTPVQWRDAYLIEYLATTGVVSKPPGSQHLKDNSNNTFIGLRIINTTHNLAYFEFTDAVTDWGFFTQDFGELYDLSVDPHQFNNIYTTVDATTRDALHTQLREQYACKGSSCR
eukprot:m.91438 g.91438  ORF g.91438 m.91438 type:complete len:619 (+) comp26469_c0_seq1:28-1884(+)